MAESEALHRIDKHEAVCAERWGALLKSNEIFHERLNSISNRMWAAAIGLIVMALGAAGSLVGVVILMLNRLPGAHP